MGAARRQEAGGPQPAAPWGLRRVGLSKQHPAPAPAPPPVRGRLPANAGENKTGNGGSGVAGPGLCPHSPSGHTSPSSNADQWVWAPAAPGHPRHLPALSLGARLLQPPASAPTPWPAICAMGRGKVSPLRSPHWARRLPRLHPSTGQAREIPRDPRQRMPRTQEPGGGAVPTASSEVQLTGGRAL